MVWGGFVPMFVKVRQMLRYDLFKKPIFTGMLFFTMPYSAVHSSRKLFLFWVNLTCIVDNTFRYLKLACLPNPLAIFSPCQKVRICEYMKFILFCFLNNESGFFEHFLCFLLNLNQNILTFRNVHWHIYLMCTRRYTTVSFSFCLSRSLILNYYYYIFSAR